jgi:cation diffusion facilitator CzcD-associated flavoprotein CzcO
MPHTDTAIVGAGPYGLSLAAHLRQRGLPFELFGQAMQSWKRFMPEGMKLKSERFASNLWDAERNFTLEAFLGKKKIAYEPTGTPLPLDLFVDYTDWFQKRNGIAANGLAVTKIAKDARGEFLLTTSDGRHVTARNVVIATGHMAFIHVPAELRDLPDTLLAHTAHLRDLSGYAGRDVTVVGAGQSALETAALLIESGSRVRIVSRRNISWNPPGHRKRPLWRRIRAPESGLAPGWRSLAYSEQPRLFRHLPMSTRHQIVATRMGPSGSAWLHDRLVGKAEFMTQRAIVSAEQAGGRARLRLNGPSGQETIETDAVVTGTGFKADIDRLSFLDADLRAAIVRENKVPKLGANFETSVPNLMVMGILSAPTFGPVMRFMFGAKHAAPIVARAIASRSRAAVDLTETNPYRTKVGASR